MATSQVNVSCWCIIQQDPPFPILTDSMDFSSITLTQINGRDGFPGRNSISKFNCDYCL